ncbi:hypothetical protein [Rhizobium alvei]|uniref:Uncharacterized protein n=1 Tax=Rhizobium alvei TaxID=1132659 RepID=A0ABT8YQ53_9HYPH|nr:hypothetical protein [Rhizobium alvei]MDO6965808.1 hypothetical protein [Rhizobium alvei]
MTKPRVRVQAGSRSVGLPVSRPQASYLRDTRSGVIASRPASLSEHRDQVRAVWRRAGALAMDMIQNSGRLRGVVDQIIVDSCGTELTMSYQPDLSRFGYHITEATDLATVANTTYHLRYTEADGFVLKSMTDLAYNPSSALETDAAFDSAFDDILVARVVTNGANVATITNLSNKARLIKQVNRRDVLMSALDWTTLSGSGMALNWGRTPGISSCTMQEWRSNNAGPDGSVTAESAGTARAVGARIPANGVSRYNISALEYYYEDTTLNHGTASFVVFATAF